MRTVHYRSYRRILKFTISKNVKITPKISKNLMWCVYVFCCAVTNSMSIKIWLWMCRMVKHTVLNKSIALCSVCSVLIFSPLHLFEFRIHINFNSKLKFFIMKIRGYIYHYGIPKNIALRVFVTNKKIKTNAHWNFVFSFFFLCYFKEIVYMIMHANRMFMKCSAIIGNDTELFTPPNITNIHCSKWSKRSGGWTAFVTNRSIFKF